MAEPTDKDTRGPVNLRIKFRSESLQQFIERYGVDVSRGGIFIRTREPLPVGTRLKLDFQLVDTAPLFQGDGTASQVEALSRIPTERTTDKGRIVHDGIEAGRVAVLGVIVAGGVEE